MDRGCFYAIKTIPWTFIGDLIVKKKFTYYDEAKLFLDIQGRIIVHANLNLRAKRQPCRIQDEVGGGKCICKLLSDYFMKIVISSLSLSYFIY